MAPNEEHQPDSYAAGYAQQRCAPENEETKVVWEIVRDFFGRFYKLKVCPECHARIRGNDCPACRFSGRFNGWQVEVSGKRADEVERVAKALSVNLVKHGSDGGRPTEWDVFICHASEDKAAFVLPLAQRFQEMGFRVWLDDWCLEVGDSLAQSIETGLRSSRYGIVVLSPAFLSKNWPRQELNAMLARESPQSRVVLPVWYKLKAEDIVLHLPLLADRVAARAEEGLDSIVSRLTRVLMVGQLLPHHPVPSNGNVSITWESLRRLTQRLFPDLKVDEFWQTQLLADLDSTMFRSIADIERAVYRASDAVAIYSRERPDLFRSGTDYITKSLGFVDLCFRSRHSWDQETLAAFGKYGANVRWDREEKTHNPAASADQKAPLSGR